MNRIEIKKDFQNRFLALRKILNSWNLIPGSPKDEFDYLNHQILSHLYNGADLEKISRVLRSELIVNYGLSTENNVVSFAEEVFDWWNSISEIIISDLIEVNAKLTLYSTECGGRKTGIKTGYRPNHVFEYKKDSTEFLNTYIGQIDFEKELILPSETEIVAVRFINYGNINEYLTNGRTWWIHEGQRKIGEAEIIEMKKN